MIRDKENTMYTNYKEQFWGDWHVTLQNIHMQLYSDFFDLIKKFFKQFN